MQKTYKDMRLEMGMTQQDIAEYLKITNSCVSLYENYKRRMAVPTCVRFVQLYKDTTGKDIDFINDIRHE